jgi:hypothetical protein
MKQLLLLALVEPSSAILALAGCGGSTLEAPSDAAAASRGGSDGTLDSMFDGGLDDVAPTGYDTDASCGPTNCPFGCCSGDTFCVFPPSPPTYCGGHGSQCVPCAGGGYYPDAACSPANCAAGCCNGLGLCVEPPTDQQCGVHGVSCFECPNGGACLGGLMCVYPVSNCGPSNCSGCCNNLPNNGGECIDGTHGPLCGSGGGSCTACMPDEQCRPIGFDGGGYCQANTMCDPSNCTGCCVNDICAQGTQNQACGYGGVACATCGSGSSCYNGSCTVGGPFAMQDAGTD